MERFLVITTTSEPALAHRACEALENAGIPVIIQHLGLARSGAVEPGLNLLVPSEHSQTARRLVDAAARRTANGW